MAAITATLTSTPHSGGGMVMSYSGTGTANQGDTLSSVAVPKTCRERVGYVLVAYSAAPTQTGVTITKDSGLGSGFDTTLYTGSANIRYTFWQPDDDMELLPGDALIVSAPAAGGVITASIEIVMERY